MQIILFIILSLGFSSDNVRIKYQDRDKVWLIDHSIYQITDGRLYVRNLEKNQNYILFSYLANDGVTINKGNCYQNY